MTTLVTLNRIRGSVKAQLTRLENLVKDETVQWTKVKIETKLKVLEKISSNVDTLRTDYYATVPDDQNMTDIDDSLLELEERLQDLEVGLLQLNSDENENKNTQFKLHSCKIKLPEIPLPQFSGKYEDWNMFKIEFNNIVTNNDELSDVQKLHYLHSALKNEAKLLETPEDTFNSLFTALENRFENKRIMVNIHLKAILEFEKIMHESAKELRRLVDAINKNIRALNNLGFERNKLSDILIITIILDKLDKDTRKQFELSINTSEVPSFDNLMTFLEKRSQSLESINKNISTRIKNTNEIKSKALVVNSNSSEKQCVICDSFHPLFRCKKFLDMKFDERFAIVKKYKLCLNCFSPKHLAAKCGSKYLCRHCNSRHSSLLHRENSVVPNDSSRHQKREIEQLEERNVTPDIVSQNLSNCLPSNKNVILSTAVIYIKTIKGNFIRGRSLLDSCSQINCVSFDFAKKLGLKKVKVVAPVSGLNGTCTTLNHKIKTIISNKNRAFTKELDFFVVPKITEITPLMPIHIEISDIPTHISLADDTFNVPGKIDLLLGAECFFDLLKAGQIRCSSQNLLFQETVFGYVASGVVNNSSPDSQYCGLLTQNEKIEKSLQKFWEIEDISDSNSQLSNEEEFCEKYFEETHYRTSDGQYVVSMPMEDATFLGESRKLAEKRLDQVWQRLDRDSNLQQLYSTFMEEYKILNHMELVEESEPGEVCYYIPHHGVYRPEKSSTRLRVVFNASTLTTSGLSLNDILLKGKIPQQELIQVMLRFRKHRYAFTADVEKMYRMILVDPSQRNLLRILWKDSIDAPVQIYKLNTVTYGTSNAPYLATRALKQLAIDEQNNLPLASSVVLNDFYVDDVLSGESTLEGAKILQSQLINLLKLGNMKLHKWCANHPELIQPENRVATEYSFDDQPECTSIKTLGVLWDPQSDCFQYKLKISDKDLYSKRDVLSLISKIFDPLGLLGPVVTRAKIFMQKLWLAKIDWNEPLPDFLAREWNDFVSTLSELENLKVPRHVFREDRIIMHGFADASLSAYGAAIYVQSLPVEGSPTAQLLCSKSRVSPIKTVTIPRLELCSCLLLAKLMHKVLPSLDVQIENVVLWTDSTISLAWIRKPPHLLKTFVSNRVAAIQDLTDSYQWQHISSENNPADVISRGLNAKELLTCEFWFCGPNLLREKIQQVENHPVDLDNNIDYAAELKPIQDYTFAIKTEFSLFNYLFTLTNNFLKLIRVISYICRFVSNCRNPEEKKHGPLSSAELKKAEVFLIKQVQYSSFAEDLKNLKNQRNLSGNSKLKFLNPYLDSEGIIRVGGRLDNSSLTYEKRHPIVLPHNHKLSELIFEYYHVKFFHLGPQSLLHHVRQKYWVLNGRSLARKTVHKCIACFRNKPMGANQIMGNLPSERVNPSPPFEKCAIDFCGPFLIKYKNQRKGNYNKIFVALFVCLATKAIHLDIVTDLKTESFIATLKRFFARRGKSLIIMSDNGATFVGTNTELKKLHALVCKPDEELSNYLASEAVTWKFIPPRSPNFGGLWEAGVKSFKYHLKRTLGTSRVTLEEFWTLTAEIEAILNSRPLIPLSPDPNEIEVLTPAHFLIGRPIISIPEPDLTKMNDNRLSNWQAITKMTQLIWKKWKKDYLNHLQQRTKWYVEKKNIKEGCMVILKEDNLPPGKWAMGRVLKVIPGSDGKIRVLEIKTATGVVTRSISKVCPLPLET